MTETYLGLLLYFFLRFPLLILSFLAAGFLFSVGCLLGHGGVI